MERIFHKDSYGYRPNKSAIDAIEITRKRCWKYDWILEFDIKGLFDNIEHELLMKADRKQLKLTQEDLAEKLSISASFQSRVERGATKISLELLGKFSETLNISLSELITGVVDNSDTFLNENLDEELNNITKNFSSSNKLLLLEIAKSISQCT